MIPASIDAPALRGGRANPMFFPFVTRPQQAQSRPRIDETSACIARGSTGNVALTGGRVQVVPWIDAVDGASTVQVKCCRGSESC